MNKESKLNLNAGDYAIRHCIIVQTYNGLEVHKMLCDAYIAGNNDTLIDTFEVKKVNLEKEIDVWYQKPPKEFENIEECAKHFFELGLKVKGE